MKAPPELLPDDKAWSRKLYKIVNKDIEHAPLVENRAFVLSSIRL
jgi:hypothetical protein